MSKKPPTKRGKSPGNTGSKGISSRRKPVTNVTVSSPKRRGDGCGYIVGAVRKTFLRAYEASFGNISYACAVAGVSRMTYYRWKMSKSRVNVKFFHRLSLIKPDERFLDFVEASLVKRMSEGSDAAIIFAAKTRGRGRGYTERPEPLPATLGEYPSVISDIRRIFNKLTEELGTDYKTELKWYLDFYGPKIKPEIRTVLTEEYETLGKG